MRHNEAKYITPFSSEEDRVFGAAYDYQGRLCTESVRDSTYAYYKQSDPIYINPKQVRKGKTLYLNGTNVYLGHYFRHHGHFLLETLPMLFYCHLYNQSTRFVFTNWMKRGVRSKGYLDDILDLLDIPQNKVLIHQGDETLIGDFIVPPRPFSIGGTINDLIPYKRILSYIHKKNASEERQEKYFFYRDPDRVSSEYNDAIVEKMACAGLKIVRPEKYLLRSQIAMLSRACCIAGFEGSALHNCLFMKEPCLVVEFLSTRRNFTSNNQKACNFIANAKHIAIAQNDIQAMDLAIKALGEI